MKQFFKKSVLALAVSIAGVSIAQACTTIVVGPEASEDGSIFIARDADGGALKAQHMLFHPAVKDQTGIHSSKAHNGANDFKYPLPANGFSYTTAPNWKTQLHGATGFNSEGVGVSGTESIYARDDALKLDPYNTKEGITEDDILDVVLPRARSAKEGAEILGSIVDKIGAGEGFGVAFIDPKEAWYLETATGHRWMAVRIPADSYFASANQGRLQQYKENDPNYIGSKDLISWAQKNGFYDPKKDGEFNFSKAYTRDDGRDRTYNDPRVWQIQKLLTPTINQNVQEGRKFPVFSQPTKKVTLGDLKEALRNHYNTGDVASHDPYTRGLRPDEPFRPIGIFRTYESHVMQIRPNLPKEIGAITYLAMGMPTLSVYVPFYQGLKKYPAAYGKGTDKADNDSAYWKFRKVQTIAMTDFPRLALIVQKRYSEYEADAAEKMKNFEQAYLKTVKSDPSKADKMLQEFNEKLILSALNMADELQNELMTIRTGDIDKLMYFPNVNKQD